MFSEEQIYCFSALILYKWGNIWKEVRLSKVR
jgi:hypothetical protein